MRRFYCAFFVLFSLQLSAQTGKYDVNLAFSHVDCDNMKFYVDIQIKAHEQGCTFHVSDQNYRFLFNSTLADSSAFIEKEFEVSGYIPSPTGGSLYQPHTLTGSQDNIISYNIEFASGEGLLIEADEWTNVGQVRFDIVDITGTVDLIYLEENMFPPTFIGEFHDETRMIALAGNFGGLEVNLQDHCGIEESDGGSSEEETTVDVINPEIENSVSLFPTLANDFINLSCGDNICRDLRIIDVQGRVMINWQAGQHTTLINKFDISTLPSGMYFFQINVNEYYLVRRFIKI